MDAASTKVVPGSLAVAQDHTQAGQRTGRPNTPEHPAPVRGRAGSRAGLLAFAIVASILAVFTFVTPAAALPAPAAALPAPATSAVEAPTAFIGPSLAGATSRWALNRAIARIPNYRKGVASWVIDNAYGHYGATNMRTRRIHISRSVPPSRLFSVVAHEYAHAMTVAIYGGNRARLNAGLARYFHAGTMMNREYSADCIARLMGARWTHYTRCTNPRWRAAAAVLMRGRPL